MFIDWYKNGKPGLVGMITGMVAGLATVTPASGFIGPVGGLILGISSGAVYYWFVGFVKTSLNMNDSLMFAVHGVGGILGALLCGLLAIEGFGGLGLESTVWEQTKVQIIGVSVAVYTFVATKIIVIIARKISWLACIRTRRKYRRLEFGSHGR